MKTPTSASALHSEARHVAGTAICASIALHHDAGQAAPEWVHLLPAGEIKTRDGRGPYFLRDVSSVIAASLVTGERLVIDENHATDLAAPEGRSAPARGWIVELQARENGLWGRVEWTEAGRRLVEDKEYRGISPNMLHDKQGNVIAIQRASLVNAPNLRGLAALHQTETDMNFLQKLREALGLSNDADEDAIVAAIKKALETNNAAPANDDKTADAAMQSALQAAIAPVAIALGLNPGADAAAVLTAAKALKAAGGDEATTVAALQSELIDVTKRLNDVVESGASEKAIAFVDGAIKAGRVGVRPMRDRYIAMHAKNPAETEELVNAMPILGPSSAMLEPPADKDGGVSLNSAQRNAASLLGVPIEDYKATLAAEQSAAAHY